MGGRATIELSQLPGRARARTMMAANDGAFDPSTDRAFAEWVVRGPQGATIEITASHSRAGVARATRELT